MTMITVPQYPLHVLLRQLGLEPPSASVGALFLCTLTIGKLEFELAESVTHGLTIQCCPGLLPEPTTAALSTLLAENAQRHDLPPINVGLLADAPANVLVWSRMGAGEATAPRLSQWFSCINELAQALHGWLGAGAPQLAAARAGNECAGQPLRH